MHDHCIDAVRLLLEQEADMSYVLMDVRVASIWDVRFIAEDEIEGPMSQLLPRHGVLEASEQAMAKRREEIAQYIEGIRRYNSD